MGMPEPSGADTEGSTGLFAIFLVIFFLFSQSALPGFPFPIHLQLSKEMFLMNPRDETLAFHPKGSKALARSESFLQALLRAQDPNKHPGFCLPDCYAPREAGILLQGSFSLEVLWECSLLAALRGGGCSLKGISALAHAGNSGHASGSPWIEGAQTPLPACPEPQECSIPATPAPSAIGSRLHTLGFGILSPPAVLPSFHSAPRCHHRTWGTGKGHLM